MNPVIINAFASELRLIKTAQTLPMAGVVSKLMSGVGQKVVDPTVAKSGVGRLGQLLTGSRQKALAKEYMTAAGKHVKKAPEAPVAGVRNVGGGMAARTEQWKGLGEMAKKELAERKAVGTARQVAAGAASAPVAGVGLTGLEGR